MKLRKNLLTKTIFCFSLFFSFFTQGQTFSASPNASILDTSTICINIPVFGLPIAIGSSFGINSACINLSHSNDSHLVIQLQSPNGTEISLASGIGGAGQNFSNTCLAMNGVNGSIVNGTAPFSGIYIPQQSLNILNNGQNPNGVWKLCISNTYFGDSGTFYDFSITFGNNPPPDPPPPPVTCTFCTCFNNAQACDLLPDITTSSLCILQNHLEQPGSLRIANATPNIGRGPLEIHAVDNCFCDTVPVSCTITCPPGTQLRHTITQRIYRRAGSDTLSHYDRTAGIMSFHPSHHHVHVDDWGSYSLRVQTPNANPTTWPIIGASTKQSFCLVNSGNCTTNNGYCKDTLGNTLKMANIPNSGFGLYNGCGLDQGIYPGYLDMYTAALNDPITFTNICNGQYYIVSVVDPLNNFLESNENNNWAAVSVTLTKQNTPMGNASFNFFVNGLQSNFTNTSPANALYLWNYGDGNWDTTYNAKHVYATPGTYTVSLVSLNKCYTMSSQTITVTGLDKYYNNGLNLTIYQNPISDNSFITFYVSEKSFVELEIFDISGRAIESLTIEAQKQGVQKFFLPDKVLSYSPGIYFLKVLDENRNTAIKKMLIK